MKNYFALGREPISHEIALRGVIVPH